MSRMIRTSRMRRISRMSRMSRTSRTSRMSRTSWMNRISRMCQLKRMLMISCRSLVRSASDNLTDYGRIDHGSTVPTTENGASRRTAARTPSLISAWVSQREAPPSITNPKMT